MMTTPLVDGLPEVAPVSLGTGPIGGFFGEMDDDRAVDIVTTALDCGITMIDTAAYYGEAERRVGLALRGRSREDVVIATKAGRLGRDEFDFTTDGIRRTVEGSLQRLGTSYVDILYLHDVEFVDPTVVLDDGLAALEQLKAEGLCRSVGISAYPTDVVMQFMTEMPIDVVLTYAHGTLLDNSLSTAVAPHGQVTDVAVVNAAAVALGLLTPGGSDLVHDHPSTATIQAAARAMRELAHELGIDIAELATQYSIQRSGAPTTVIGATASSQVRAAVAVAENQLDIELVGRFLALRPPRALRSWPSEAARNRAGD